ncbi:MAG: zinc ribbon domain-containing protein [Ruminococcaceae bacterium]|nr:zinc ribbon domain-containing protein [Oscillospiraceae bacterium]
MNCPSCGCQMSGAARFCPMCGVIIRQDAVDARFGKLPEVPLTEPPLPDETLLRRYAGLNHCGAGIVRALKVLAALLAVVIGVCGVVYGVMLLLDRNTLQGIISLVLGPGIGLLLYVTLSFGIVLYENISFIARQSEMQNRISAAQLELVNDMLHAQKEELEMTRQNSELLRVLDGTAFDAVKQAERQNELLDRLTEIQRAGEQKLISIKDSTEQLNRLFAGYEKSSHTWRSNARQFSHAVALAVSQLPERIRRALAGEQSDTEATDDDTVLTAESGDMEIDSSEAAENENT